MLEPATSTPMTLKKGYYDEPANTAPMSALGEAITKDSPPLVLAGSPKATASAEGMDTTGSGKQTETIDIL